MPSEETRWSRAGRPFARTGSASPRLRWPLPRSAISVATTTYLSVRAVILLDGVSCYERGLPSMASGARRPRAYAVVCTYEIVASIYSIVTVGESLDEFSIHKRAGATVSALVVGAQGIGEGYGWRGQEGRRKRPRRSLRKQRDARLKAKGRFPVGRWRLRWRLRLRRCRDEASLPAAPPSRACEALQTR